MASLDLYLSSWDEWEAMTACSPLPHTHTSKCNLRGRLPKEIPATVPQCQSLTSEQSSTSDSTGNNITKQDEKKRKRSESRRRRKQRRKERNRNVELVAEHQAVLSAAVGDISKLAIEGPRRVCRYFAASWGYEAVPEPFVRKWEKRRRWKERQRCFQRRRRRLCDLLVWIRGAILLSHVAVEPLAICLRYQAQLVGIVITQRGIDVGESGVFNQLGFVSSLLGASLFAAIDRRSVQSRISLGLLIYYHTLYLSHCSQDLRGLSLSAITVDGSYSYLALYHVGFYLYFPIDLACKRLDCATS